MTLAKTVYVLYITRSSLSQIAFSHGISPGPPLQSLFVFCELHSSLQRAWIGDLLGGPLMSRESRVIAELLLTDPDEQTWQEQIVGHNILQASSPNTAKRYAATIRLRLNTLDKSAWTLIAEGSERERQQLLFVALTLHSPVVKDFLAEVVNDSPASGTHQLLRFIYCKNGKQSGEGAC